MSLEQEQRQITSEKKIHANRENAQKSTGPRTDSGKSLVSRNAFKHGLLGKSLTFDSEAEEEIFEQFRSEIQDELLPVGVVETILVSEFVTSLWKQQTAQRWSLQELSHRRKAAVAILRACAASSGFAINPFSEEADAGESTSVSGWDCKELTVKVGPRPSESTAWLDPEDVDEQEQTPNVQFEAKLSTSAETFLRYETAWKKDMYRALETLKTIQQARLAKSKDATA